jgi:hypothetical protein
LGATERIGYCRPAAARRRRTKAPYCCVPSPAAAGRDAVLALRAPAGGGLKDSSVGNSEPGLSTGDGPSVQPPGDIVACTGNVCGAYPSRVKVTVKSLPSPISIVQGVWQAFPVEVFAVAPAGVDSISISVVVGFGFMKLVMEDEEEAAVEVVVDEVLHDARATAVITMAAVRLPRAAGPAHMSAFREPGRCTRRRRYTTAAAHARLRIAPSSDK